MERIACVLTFIILLGTIPTITLAASSSVSGFSTPSHNVSMGQRYNSGIYSGRRNSSFNNRFVNNSSGNYERRGNNIYYIRPTEPIPRSNFSSEQNIPTISCQGTDTFRRIGNQVYKCNSAAATRIKVASYSSSASNRNTSSSKPKSSSNTITKTQTTIKPKIVRVKL